jgi:uncharacterized lipoprotein YddW (UPF0748 family)
MRHFLLIAILFTFLTSCEDWFKTGSSENKILQIAVKEDPDAVINIDSVLNTISIAVKSTVPVNAITINLAVSPKSVVTPVSGTKLDFTNPVKYTVIAENGDKREYTISVNNLSGEKKIISASVATALTDIKYNAVVAANTVSILVPYGIDLSKLKIDAVLSPGAVANPAFGTENNYSSPVVHTITAANGTKTAYTVTVTNSPQETAVRAVWVTNVASEVLFSEANLTAMVDKLAELNFNTICVTAYNKSQTLFPSQTLAAVLGVTPSETVIDGCRWGDVMGKLIEKAKAKNIKVIAWFEYGFASHYAGQSQPITDKKPQWVSKQQDGTQTVKNNFYWLNGFHPEVQKFLTDMIVECVTKYPDLAGIQGDDRLPALPAHAGYDDYTKQLYKTETGKDLPTNPTETAFFNWKAQKMTDYATSLYNAVKAARSTCLVTWAPSARGWAKDNYLQDWPQWVANGKADWVSPQQYRNESQGLSSYSTLIDGDISAVFTTTALKRKYVPGMLVRNGGYLPTDAFLAKMIQHNRSKGVLNESTWFYEGVIPKQTVFKTLYSGKALFPTLN